MGRKSFTGGVTPAGLFRIQFDFSVGGQRFRPTLSWIPSETNLRRERELLTRVKAQIVAGTFHFADEFPDYRGTHRLPDTVRRRSCNDVFDAFLHHEPHVPSASASSRRRRSFAIVAASVLSSARSRGWPLWSNTNTALL